MLGYSIYRHGTPGTAHIGDAAIAIGHRILQALCGPTWKAQRVQFFHGQPDSSAPYRRVFRSSVSFDADVPAIVFASSWLERPIEGADATLRSLLARAIQDALDNGPMLPPATTAAGSPTRTAAAC
jgi:hypothetical protein